MKKCVSIFLKPLNTQKTKGDCFRKDATDEFILDVRRQVYISTPLEKALTDALQILNVYEEKEIEECLIELNSLE